MNVPVNFLYRTIVLCLMDNIQGLSEAEAKKKFRLVQELPFGSYPVIKKVDPDIDPYIETDVLESYWAELESIVAIEDAGKAAAADNAAIMMRALGTLFTPSISDQYVKYALLHIFDDLSN